jgi:hypothetical protein
MPQDPIDLTQLPDGSIFYLRRDATCRCSCSTDSDVAWIREGDWCIRDAENGTIMHPTCFAMGVLESRLDEALDPKHDEAFLAPFKESKFERGTLEPNEVDVAAQDQSCASCEVAISSFNELGQPGFCALPDESGLNKYLHTSCMTTLETRANWLPQTLLRLILDVLIPFSSHSMRKSLRLARVAYRLSGSTASMTGVMKTLRGAPPILVELLPRRRIMLRQAVGDFPFIRRARI